MAKAPKSNVRDTSVSKARSARKRARGSGAQTVCEELRRDILALTLEPGTLLDETELALRFHMSRSPIREALIRLSAEGLVQTLRNRSSIVAPFDVVAIPSYVDALSLMYRVTTRLAAENRRPAQLARIKEAFKEHASATTRADAPEMIRLNHEFHQLIAEATGNSFYVTWTRQLLEQGQRIVGLFLQDVSGSQYKYTISHHQAMMQAIERQDADAAEQAAQADVDILPSRLTERLMSKPSVRISFNKRQSVK